MPQNLFAVVVRYNEIVGIFSQKSFAERYIQSIDPNSALGKEELLIEEYDVDDLVGED